MKSQKDQTAMALGSYAAIGLWLLPIYGLLLALGTITHQPDISQFRDYAEYVTTPVFLVSHLAGSVGGSALAILGAMAALNFLARGPAARAATAGVILTVIANVYLAAAFGSAAFVQPGIGRAYLNGVPGMEALNKDTAYGTALIATAVGSLLVFIAAATVLGVAIARTDPQLRLAGVGYAVALPLFGASGILFQPLQPLAGLMMAAAAVVIAIRLPKVALQEASHQQSV
jgi:hypothetical protein